MAVRTTGEKGRVMKSQPNAKKSMGKRISVEVKRHWQLYLMLVLPVTYLIIFAYFPMGGAIIAFKDYSIRGGIWGSEWVGLKHFKNFFTTPDFKNLMTNTLALSLYSLIISFPMPILLALAINEMRGRHYKKMVQMVTYLPYFISTVVLVGIMQNIFSVRTGLVNNIITLFLKINQYTICKICMYGRVSGRGWDTAQLFISRHLRVWIFLRQRPPLLTVQAVLQEYGM